MLLTKGRKMKQLLVLAIALTSVNAFATRARVTALGNSPHQPDTATVYAKPYHIFALASDYATLETGATGGTAPTLQNKNAEGMLVRTMGDAKLGLSLGHQSLNESSWGPLRSISAALGDADLAANQQNPIEFTYGKKSGDMTWAGTLVYSNYNNKLAAAGTLEKESSMGLRFGATSGAWDAVANLGLTNTANVINGNKFTGTPAIGVSGGYMMDSMYFFGGLTTSGAKEETAAAVEVYKVANQSINVGVVNSHKKDGNDLYYSIALNQSESKYTVAATDTKITSLTLPITVGVEAEAASWLTLRGSVSQATMINNTKNEVAGTEFAPAANSTTVAVGAGLKFNKLTFDGTMSTATTQVVNAADLLGQVGMTYWF